MLTSFKISEPSDPPIQITGIATDEQMTHSLASDPEPLPNISPTELHTPKPSLIKENAKIFNKANSY